jgi:hypothetical protein
MPLWHRGEVAFDNEDKLKKAFVEASQTAVDREHRKKRVLFSARTSLLNREVAAAIATHLCDCSVSKVC